MAIMRAFCFNTGRNSSKTTFWRCRLNRNIKDKLFNCFIGFWRTRTSNEFGLIALENSDHMPGEFGPIA